MKKTISVLVSSLLLLLALSLYAGREKEAEAGAFGDTERKEVNVVGIMRKLTD